MDNNFELNPATNIYIYKRTKQNYEGGMKNVFWLYNVDN